MLILQHLNADGPAYLSTWLKSRGQEFEVFNTEAGHTFTQRNDSPDERSSVHDAEQILEQTRAF